MKITSKLGGTNSTRSYEWVSDKRGVEDGGDPRPEINVENNLTQSMLRRASLAGPEALPAARSL